MCWIQVVPSGNTRHQQTQDLEQEMCRCLRQGSLVAPMRSTTPSMNEHSRDSRDLNIGWLSWRFALRRGRRGAVFGLPISEICCHRDAAIGGDPRPCPAAVRHIVPAFGPLQPFRVFAGTVDDGLKSRRTRGLGGFSPPLLALAAKGPPSCWQQCPRAGPSSRGYRGIGEVPRSDAIARKLSGFRQRR
jgi:hypothetical protein